MANLEKAVFKDLERFEVKDGPGAPEGNANAAKINPDKSKNVRIDSPLKQYGNASAHRAAKLKRDHPDVHARLIAGEFKNVAEAERAAGVGRPVISQLDRVLAAFQRLFPDDREKFMELAGSMMDRHRTRQGQAGAKVGPRPSRPGVTGVCEPEWGRTEGQSQCGKG